MTTLKEVLDYLSENLTIDVGPMPEYHAGETGPPYLRLKIGERIISSMDRATLQQVFDEEWRGW